MSEPLSTTELLRKCRESEGESLEFKLQLNIESDREKEELAKDLTAFANTKGGMIVIGVRDKPREVIGLREPLNAERIMDSITSRTYPPIHFQIHNSSSTPMLGVILVPPGRFVHELINSNVVYVRRDRISKRATSAEIYRLKSEREYVNRTVLLDGRRLEAIDNRIALIGQGISDYLIGEKSNDLYALSECPVFLPAFSRHMSAPQFGNLHSSILTEYYSHSTIEQGEFLSKVQEVDGLLCKLGSYLNLDDVFHWSISDEGSFAFGCGLDTLSKAMDDGKLGMITLARCGEFRGASNDRSFLLLLAGYCKYRESKITWVQNPEIALYLSFVPITSDWVQTLLQPFLDEDSPFSTLSYELAQPRSRIWMPMNGYDVKVPITGTMRKYKFESSDQWTQVESVVADTDWFAERAFNLEVDWETGLDFPHPRNRNPRITNVRRGECPLSNVSTCLVSLSGTPVDVEDIESREVKSFQPTFIRCFEVGMGAHSVHVIGVDGFPHRSART